MNKKLVVITSAAIGAFPALCLAVFNPGQVPFAGDNGIVLTTNGIINNILSFIWMAFIAFAVIMFIVAGFHFFTAEGDPDKAKEARQFVIWGVVGIIVGVLAFSLPFLVQNSFR